MPNDDMSHLGYYALSLTNPLILPLVRVDRRAHVDLLWALDRRLARLARGRAEPALRQIRLRWWADQLEKLHRHDHSEPMLQQAAQLFVAEPDRRAVGDLAEAWFETVGADSAEVLERPAMLLFTDTARLIGANANQAMAAGRAWSQFDWLCHGAGSAAEWDQIRRELRAASAPSLSRPLAALVAQARSVAARDGQRSLVREQLSILRAGVFGR